MTEFKHGTVKISNDIIDQLIAETALQVDGVASVSGYRNGKLEKNKKDGIATVIYDNKTEIAITVKIEKDKNIYDVVEKIQKSITEQINTILGFEVLKVNVFVKDIK